MKINPICLHLTGGMDEYGAPLDVTEIFVKSGEVWDEGPYLPRPLAGASMAILGGRPALLGGKPAGADPVGDVTVLGDDGEWETEDGGGGMSLRVPRAYFGLASVPTTLFDEC